MSSNAIQIAVGASGLLACLPAGCLGDIIQKCLYKYQISGLVVSDAAQEKEHIISNLVSADTMFIDVDLEVFHALSEDEKDASTKNSSSIRVNRTIYTKARTIVSDLIELVNGTSKSTKKICFISSDYRLLKYLGVPSISYTIGSSTFYNSLNLSAEDKTELDKVSDDLKKNKGSKLFVYSSLDDLLRFVANLYNASLKI